MRLSRAMARLFLVVVVVGCGRSNLTDDLGLAGLGDDAGGALDDSSSLQPTNDVSVSPPEDVTVLSGDDLSLIPPPHPPPRFVDVAELPPPPSFFDSAPTLEVDVFVPPGGCSFATCSGCCDENGACHSGHDNSGCGGQGERCRTCNQICVDGICLNLSSNCGPSNCTGCCLGTDVCTDGLHAGACGSGGVQCESCNPATGGGRCVSNSSGTGGSCVTPPNAGCGPSSCPTGCCVGNLCVVGTQDIACGSEGVLCQDCTQNGHTCLGRTCSF